MRWTLCITQGKPLTESNWMLYNKDDAWLDDARLMTVNGVQFAIYWVFCRFCKVSRSSSNWKLTFLNSADLLLQNTSPTFQWMGFKKEYYQIYLMFQSSFRWSNNNLDLVKSVQLILPFIGCCFLPTAARLLLYGILMKVFNLDTWLELDHSFADNWNIFRFCLGFN